MKILFAALGAYGHLYPLLPLATSCAAAGHQVVVATGPPFLDRLSLPTVPAYPVDHDLATASAETGRRHPELAGFEFALAMFADVTAGSVIPVLLDQLAADRPDLVVYEGLISGAGVAADLLGIPAAAYSIELAQFFAALVHEQTVRYHRNRWLERGRQPPDGTPLLARALIDPTPPTLRPPGASGRPTLPIRPVAYSESAAPVPDWLLHKPTRPRVYLTLGTVAFGAVEVLARALSDLAPLDLELLVTVGPEGDPGALGAQPPNVHVERFVAQSAVLLLVDLIVHHGGTGTVLGALGAGLPQLILPQGADQFANASTVTAVGAGRSLRNDQQQPGTIAEAVRAMLGASPERAVAQAVRAEIAEMPDPADVVPALVDLARGSV